MLVKDLSEDLIDKIIVNAELKSDNFIKKLKMSMFFTFLKKTLFSLVRKMGISI
jgi:hypothetical protein